MNKLLKLIVPVFLLTSFTMSSNSGYAQATGVSTLTLSLADVIVLVVTDVPILTFADEDDYTSGISTTNATAGTVTSTFSPWDLTVKAAAANFVAVGTGTIPVNTITVSPSSSTGTLADVTLDVTEQTLIDEASPGLLRVFGITFSTQPNEPAFVGATGAFTTVLTYTATAD